MPAPDKTKIRKMLRELPHSPGVYLMRDSAGVIIYVGKAADLKKRVSSYFQVGRNKQHSPKIKALISLIADFEIITVRSEAEALILESQLIKQWKPRYNTSLTDDKRFLLIRVHMEQTLPRFRLVRNRTDERSLYFGPFVHATEVRKILLLMRKKFGILLSDARPQDNHDGKWALYTDMRAELYPHPNCVTSDEYLKRVHSAIAFLQGKTGEWVSELREKMKTASDALDFERAAGYRDLLLAMNKTLEKNRRFSRPVLAHWKADAGLTALQEALGMKIPPHCIECFDISHISGTFCVAAMVQFREGRPASRNHRRFHIRSFVGNDDFRAMEEVVERRYGRLQREGKPLPELIVIDGGIGQVNAALHAFERLALPIPMLIGLAKKEETIIFPDPRPPLSLPSHHDGLRLLQRVRDEAHRFANTFNADLRSKRLKESLLDDAPGIGAVRKKRLFEHFKSLEKLKNATPEAIAHAGGFSVHAAETLLLFLGKEPTP
jgi:excinuclease ABC subunit C